MMDEPFRAKDAFELNIKPITLEYSFEISAMQFALEGYSLNVSC